MVNKYYDATKAHHTRFGFRDPEAVAHQLQDLQRWRAERKKLALPPPPQNGYAQFIQDWWQPVDLSGNQDAIWWLGHASLLLRLAGKYILIDPVLSPRASPVNFYGPIRKTPPPIKVKQLPPIDLVLISHNHYDHLDRDTIRELTHQQREVIFIVPLGLKRWFRGYPAKRVIELDWWQSYQIDAMTIHATTAKHWSMRTPWDRNQSLWCGWVIHHPALRFYFTGDSSYSERLAEVGSRLGPFDFAALPIGAYAPRWFMREQHMDPQQAVRLYQQLNQPKVIPIHWGVFELADEALDEPPQELARALNDAGLLQHQFQPIKIGSHVNI
ncbi:MBL fold metallo-hydrolase [Serratia microhaemolytica]|uniref:MBL fold metallo-hydrolase n=1 Tax=Serratia microhaemolytica TaxID=2675110 RepID=UPI003B83434F